MNLDRWLICEICSFLNPLDIATSEILSKEWKFAASYNWSKVLECQKIISLTFKKRLDYTPKIYSIRAWQNRRCIGDIVVVGGSSILSISTDLFKNKCCYSFKDNLEDNMTTKALPKCGFPKYLTAPAVTVDGYGNIITIGGCIDEESINDTYLINITDYSTGWKKGNILNLNYSLKNHISF